MNAAAARNVQVPLIDQVKNHPGANISDAYRALVRLAINAKLLPAEIHIEGIARASVFFPPALFAQIEAIAEEHGLTFQRCVAGLAAAGADKAKYNSAPGVEVVTPFKSDRPDQKLFYKCIVQGIAAGKIVVAEGSTGIGKSRALIAAAVDAVQAGKVPTIVAAPTVTVLNHLWTELQTLRKEDGVGLLATATILPGSTEFADDVKLTEWATQASGEDEAVAAWVLAGGPHLADDAIGQVAKEQGIKLCWLMSDLRSLATNVSVEDYGLDRGVSKADASASIARQILAQIRDAANRKSSDESDEEMHAGADIIFCTHAMLALGQKTQWRVLPKPATIFVDEAHLLEETISRINSHDISLFATGYRIDRFCREVEAKSTSVPKKAHALVKSLIKSCQDISVADARIRIENGSQDLEFLREKLSELGGMLNSRAFAKMPNIGNERATIDSAIGAMKSPSERMSTHLHFSPDLRYPRISVGAESVGQQAGALWKAAVGGVVLASATMYITDEYGNQKCDYVVRNLAIPLSRLDTPSPIISAMIYSLPVLHIPGPEHFARLTRPSSKSRTETDSEADWIKSISERIAQIAETAVGGTLVLSTAYAQIESIHRCLQDRGAGERVVAQSKRQKFALTKQAFIDAHRRGLRPIMLGLGPAWTGVDLLDPEAKSGNDDKLLTDLIVACCPLGLNQSPTMLRRIDLTGTNAVSKEALLTLKQGLGRLIRRDGVTDRRIWILDPRIWAENWLNQFTGPAKRLLRSYKKVEHF